MSDDYQDLVFDSIEGVAAEQTIKHAMRWMILNGYVLEARTECAYSKDGFGHPPGPRWRDIVDEAEENRSWHAWSEMTGRPVPSAEDIASSFLRLQTNGVDPSSERGVSHPGELGDSDTPQGGCPACKEKLDTRVDFFGLVERWAQRETCEVECPNCRVISRLQDWDWQPYWAFGEAHLTFWNWPTISARAISELSASLGDVRVRHIYGRI